MDGTAGYLVGMASAYALAALAWWVWRRRTRGADAPDPDELVDLVCETCGGPIQLTRRALDAARADAARLGVPRLPVRHEVCPTETALPDRKRYVVRVALLVEDQEYAAFDATAEADTFVDAFEPLSDALNEQWSRLQRSSSLIP